MPTAASSQPVPARYSVRAGSCLVLLAALLAGLLAPPCQAQAPPISPPTGSPLSALPPRAVVFAADGAGNFRAASLALANVVADDDLPLEVRSFEWSHGLGRILSDQMSFNYTREHGQALAALILEFREAHSCTPIMLYSHSAGCTVATAALEALPAGVVEHAVLLSPSMSARYDLKPSLAKVRRGLHVFYSKRDWCYLGMSTWLLGTADRRFDWCGGRTGFQIDPGQLEPSLEAKLSQRAWQPEDRELGNNGGHYGHYQPNFLRAHVVPLLLPETSAGQSPSPRS